MNKINYIYFLCLLFGISFHATAQTPVATIPFEAHDKSIVLLVKLNDNPRTLRLLFDTGADGMAVSQALADTLGLKATRQQNTSVVGGSMQISISQNNDVHMGSFTLKGQSIAFFKEMSKDLDGIIGNTMTRQYITKIDFDKKVLQLFNFENYTYEKEGTTIPVLSTGVFIIPGDVAVSGGKVNRGEFVFDTGAAYNLICFRPFVRKNRLLVSGFVPEYQASTTSMGVTSPTFNGKAESFSFANMTPILNMPISLMAGGGQNENWNPGFDGSIGMRIIYRYNFTINYQKKEIHLTPNQNYGNPLDFVISGYSFGYNLNGELAMENLVRQRADLRIPEGAVIKSINGISGVTLKKNKKALESLIALPKGSAVTIEYVQAGKINKEIITK